jgi:hypothetical protein
MSEIGQPGYTPPIGGELVPAPIEARFTGYGPDPNAANADPDWAQLGAQASLFGAEQAWGARQGTEDIKTALGPIGADASTAAAEAAAANAQMGQVGPAIGRVEAATVGVQGSVDAGFSALGRDVRGVGGEVRTLGDRVDAGFSGLGSIVDGVRQTVGALRDENRQGHEAIVLGIDEAAFGVRSVAEAVRGLHHDLVVAPREAAAAQLQAAREQEQREVEQRWMAGLTGEEPLSQAEQNAVRRNLGMPQLYEARRPQPQGNGQAAAPEAYTRARELMADPRRGIRGAARRLQGQALRQYAFSQDPVFMVDRIIGWGENWGGRTGRVASFAGRALRTVVRPNAAVDRNMPTAPFPRDGLQRTLRSLGQNIGIVDRLGRHELQPDQQGTRPNPRRVHLGGRRKRMYPYN